MILSGNTGSPTWTFSFDMYHPGEDGFFEKYLTGGVL